MNAVSTLLYVSDNTYSPGSQMDYVVYNVRAYIILYNHFDSFENPFLSKNEYAIRHEEFPVNTAYRRQHNIKIPERKKKSREES